MASSKGLANEVEWDRLIVLLVKIPKPASSEGDDGTDKGQNPKVPLPQTLVRIPVDAGDFGLDPKGSEDDG